MSWECDPSPALLTAGVGALPALPAGAQLIRGLQGKAKLQPPNRAGKGVGMDSAVFPPGWEAARYTNVLGLCVPTSSKGLRLFFPLEKVQGTRRLRGQGLSWARASTWENLGRERPFPPGMFNGSSSKTHKALKVQD